MEPTMRPIAGWFHRHGENAFVGETRHRGWALHYTDGRMAHLFPVPVLDQEHVRAPAAELRAQALPDREHLRSVDQRQDVAVADYEVVHADEELRTPGGVELAFGLRMEPVVLGVLPAARVAADPLVGLAGGLPGEEYRHEETGIGLADRGVVHLDVGREAPERIGVAGVGGEEHRGGDRLELQVEAGLAAGLLDDRLRLLARGVGGGLEEELQLAPILAADAVGSPLPSRRLERAVRLVDVELPRGALRAESRRLVEEVGGDLGRASVDVLLDRLAVDGEREGLAHGAVGEDGMARLRMPALALHLGPGVGEVEADVLDVAGVEDSDSSLAAALEALQDLVFDLQVVGVVELTGLQHGAC